MASSTRSCPPAMAIFGAPLPLPEPELAAVRAALDMQEMIEMFNHERVALEKEPIRTGIGIASGEVVAGYTGTQQRATCTCIGDTVNLAARLEAHTKVAGVGVFGISANLIFNVLVFTLIAPLARWFT